ncbi:pyridoxamine 5'-phosphate oxidase family protein [Paraburkholderia sp. SIMBA_009]|uniref:Pyridoxine/pyridoxamine 5'-phosphate oxidase n=1 Tax=Paraburkholderia tropica TaxID=92647 RepID=A0AAQ1GPC5_9BURK|nr:pyridoxamine 5'-phosphate oxidase family protein [Paraburkholderia tropica]RQN37169.1 pyridoxamine 5'-phosphate oxidase [Paraburkholderia tropica]SEK15391.1 Pyridoxine/pyridoxamine 5'-phosphate oxidase [Paraburkholderia tropica]
MTLDEIYARIWDCLRRAAADAPQEAPSFVTMQAATVGIDGAPSVRTVLLRDVSEPEGLISFHTDRRSPKLAELVKEPRIALVGVDARHSLQIRLAGTAGIVLDDAARRLAWISSPDHSLIVYRTTIAPGTRIYDPDDAFGADHIGDEADGFANFCVVKVRLDSLEWLKHSSNERHERARYIRVGGAWEPTWIAP